MSAEAISIIVTCITVIIALLVSWLAFILLIRVVKASIVAVIGIAAVLLFLQLAFGISPLELWLYITLSFQSISRYITDIILRILRLLGGR